MNRYLVLDVIFTVAAILALFVGNFTLAAVLWLTSEIYRLQIVLEKGAAHGRI